MPGLYLPPPRPDRTVLIAPEKLVRDRGDTRLLVSAFAMNGIQMRTGPGPLTVAGAVPRNIGENSFSW